MTVISKVVHYTKLEGVRYNYWLLLLINSPSYRLGLALETQEVLNQKTFSVALKSLDILESAVFTEATGEECTLHITYLTSGNHGYGHEDSVVVASINSQ